MQQKTNDLLERAAEAVAGPLVLGKRVAIVSPRLVISREVLKDVAGRLAVAGARLELRTGNGAEKVELYAGGVARIFTTSKGSGRGITVDVLVVLDDSAPLDMRAVVKACGGRVVHVRTEG